MMFVFSILVAVNLLPSVIGMGASLVNAIKGWKKSKKSADFDKVKQLDKEKTILNNSDNRVEEFDSKDEINSTSNSPTKPVTSFNPTKKSKHIHAMDPATYLKKRAEMLNQNSTEARFKNTGKLTGI